MVAALLSSPRHTCILLAAHDQAFAERLSIALSNGGYRAELVGDGEAQVFLQRLKTEPVDAILLGNQPAGLALCRLLRQTGCTLPVLLLIDSDCLEVRAAGLDAGADDLAVYPCSDEQLLDQVRFLLRREQVRSDGLLRLADLSMNVRTREVRRAQRSIDLTAKEFELLRYLLEHPREVLSREHILLNVWGEDFMGESNIIEVYIRYLRMKIEREDEKKLIHTVRGVGYTLRD